MFRIFSRNVTFWSRKWKFSNNGVISNNSGQVKYVEEINNTLFQRSAHAVFAGRLWFEFQAF